MNDAGPSPAQADAPWAGDERDFLLWLSDTLREEPDPQVILRRTTEALGRRTRVDAVTCAEIDSAVEFATVTCEWLSGRIPGRLGVRHRIADYAPPELMAGLHRGEPDIIKDVRTDPRLEGARRAIMSSEGIVAHLSVPLVAHGQLRFIIILSYAEARGWPASEIALVQEAAVRTWATMERARADAALQAAEQNQRFLVGLGDRLRALSDPQEVLLAAAETLGRHLAVNRAGYAELEPDGTLVIGRDWTDGTVAHGTSRQAIAGFGPAVVEPLERGETGRFDDARTDPRVGPAQRPAFEAMEIVAALTVPLVKGGRLVGMLSVQQKTPRTWTEAEVQLVEEVAERTWEALERSRAELALRVAEQNQRFVLELGDRLRLLDDPETVLLTAAEAIGRKLGVDRVGYAQVTPEETLVFGRDWIGPNAEPVPSGAPLSAFGAGIAALLRSGRTLRVDDAASSPVVEEAARASFEAIGMRAVIVVPLVHGGRLESLLGVQSVAPRVWSDDEQRLAEELAQRTWAAFQRAQAELALRDSEQQFRQLANNLPALCWMADAEGRPFWFNRRWCEYFGLSDGEETAEAWDSRSGLPPELLESVEARWAEALTTQEPFDMSLPLRGRDGVLRTFLTRVEPMRGADDRVVRWFGMNTDITEQMEAERTNAFLLELGDKARRLTDPAEVLRTSIEMLGLHLGASRVGWAEVEPDGVTIEVAHNWANGVASVVGRHSLEAFGQAHLEVLRAGRTYRVDDAFQTVPAQDRQAFDAMHIRAAVTVPLIKQDEFVALISVQQDVPRAWTAAEVGLIEEVAERTWAAHEWARAEMASRESEQQFRQLANNLPALCWMADQDGRPYWFNRRWCEFFGVEDGSAASWDRLSGLEPQQVAELETSWTQALARQEPFEMTLALKGREGPRTFLTRVEPMLGAEGRVVRWFGMNTDITEQIEAERTRAFLLWLEDRLRPLTDPDDIVQVVAEELGRHIGANRTGYAEVQGDEFVVERPWNDGQVGDAIGRYPVNSFDPAIIEPIRRGETFVCGDVQTDPRISDAYRGAYSAIEIQAIITKPLLKDGELVAIMTVNQKTPRVWSDADARLVGEVGERAWASLARARAEANLRESQALLAAFMENAPVGMFLKDSDARYVLANSGMERLFRRPASEAIGLTPQEVFPPEMAAIAAQQDALALAQGRAQVSYQVPGDPDGGWNLIIRFPIRGEGGDRMGGFVIDIDEQKRAEAELARSREALYQSEKLTALGSLLAGVSHELNNPLAVVVGQSMMLEEEAEGSPFERRALKIRGAAERCARIVQTFLAMARQKPPVRTLVDANQVVQGALDLVEYGLRTAGVTVRKRLEPQLPPLSADADQLHQVVANLLVNAQHALQGVSGPREVSVTTRTAASGKVEIEVADNGPGVPADIRRRVFEPFFTTKPQGLGTGLGLSFSHGVVEAHGGRLELLDREGGAAFRISLPAVAGSRTEAGTPALPTAAPGRGAALVIDDEPEIADMLAELLRRQGYQVSTAESGRDGRAQLEAGRFDIVLSDLRMPDMDGPALFEWMARDRPDLTKRLGFVTGDTLGPAASTFLARAGRPYLEKPFTPAAVRAFVTKLAAETPAKAEA